MKFQSAGPSLTFLLLSGVLVCPTCIGQADVPATRPAGGAEVPVKDVVLFSSGVGYFEHFGTVKDDGSTVLHFKTGQINDILKSLLLEDLDGGKVAAVSYPSPAPLARTLKSFQVDITSNPPLPQLLNQLRGARIEVAVGPDQRFEGTILGVETRTKAVGDKQVLTVSVLSLRSGRTIRTVLLDDVQELQMQDPKLNEELDAALAAVAQARDQDKKPVEIHFAGQGERRVRVGYVVETPVWKTSYRLVLDNPRGNAAGAKLQGWAIVENQTDSDWNDIQLSLVSGRPISFIQDLYHSLYVPRPVVQPQIFASLIPQTYENGITQAEMTKLQQARNAANSQFNQLGAGVGGAGATVANQLFANANAGRAGGAAPQQPPIDPIASVISQASASGLGELFQFTVRNVSIPRQQSAMIPIVSDDVKASKVSIYNRAVLANHPLNGARLKNNTTKHLLAGPVTVLEAGSYAGDAQIDDVPPGQSRLLSYGVDLKVLVQADDRPQLTTLQTARLLKGVLQLKWKDVARTEFLLDNKGETAKTIVVEFPRQPEWKLTDPPAPDETTEQAYRIQRELGAGKLLKLPVVQEMVRAEEVALLPLEADKLDIYAKVGEMPAGVRDALQQVLALKQAAATTVRQIDQHVQQVGTITTEQSRIRENMKAVSPSTDYYARLVKKLDQQETQIETLQQEVSGLQKQLDSQRKELDNKLAELTLG